MEKNVITSLHFLLQFLKPFASLFLSQMVVIAWHGRVHDAIFPLSHLDHASTSSTTSTTSGVVSDGKKPSSSSLESRCTIRTLQQDGRTCFKCDYTAQCIGCPLPDNDDRLPAAAPNIYLRLSLEPQISFGVLWPLNINVITPASLSVLSVPMTPSSSTATKEMIELRLPVLEYHISARPTHNTEMNEIIRMDRTICTLPKSLQSIVTNHQTVLHWKSSIPSNNDRKNSDNRTVADDTLDITGFGSVVRLRNDQSKCPYNNNINGSNRCLCSIQPNSVGPY
jgi:hypothetical protein